MGMDAATKKMLAKQGKKCPICTKWILKNSGCNTMMCGTNSHGSLKTALINGGCGACFYWDSLKIIERHDYIGLNGKKQYGRMTDNRHLLKDPKWKHVFGVH